MLTSYKKNEMKMKLTFMHLLKHGCHLFLAYFRDQVYEAVLSATSRSLALLAESCGCDGEVVRVISAMSNHSQSSGASSPSPRGWGSRPGSPMEAGEGQLVSARSRPLSSLSQLSTMTWTTEKTHAITYLQ